MPQLDKLAYISEIFWLIFFFFFIYLVVVYYFLPNIFVSLKYRVYKLSKLSSSSSNFGDTSKNIISGYGSFVSSVVKQYFIYQADVNFKLNEQVTDVLSLDLFLKENLAEVLELKKEANAQIRLEILSKIKKVN